LKRFEKPAGRRETITIDTASPDETFRLGVMIGRSIGAGTALSLEGGLGAGKTLLVKGIVEGMGIKAEVLSPTFILVEEYRGEVPVFHFDLYRLEQFEEVERIGFFDAIDGRNVVIAEWGDRLPEGAVRFDVVVRISMTGESSRRITIEAPAGLAGKLDGGAR
jgi:tRNA threonylcarbamoyladenosine biosynthesis protein TsaE